VIDTAALQAQTQRLQAALMQRRLWPANDNDPPDPPPALSQRLPRDDWRIIKAFGAAA